MAGIKRVIPGKVPPFGGDFERAIREATAEAAKLRANRAQLLQINNNYAAVRQGQGSVLEPFNFTAVINRLFQMKKEEIAARSEEKAAARPAMKASVKTGDKKELRSSDKGKKEKKPVEEVQVRVDEHGAVIEEKDMRPETAEKAGVRPAARTTKTVVRATAPAADIVAETARPRDEREYKDLLGSVVPVADVSQYRLGGRRPAVVSAEKGAPVRASSVTDMRRADGKNVTAGPAASYPAGMTGRPDTGPAPETELQQREADESRTMMETAYKADQQRIEARWNDPEELKAEREAEARIIKGISRAAAIISAADAVSATEQEYSSPGEKMTATIPVVKTETPVPHINEENMNAAAAQHEHAAGSPPMPAVSTDMDSILVTAININNVTGRDIQFEKGESQLQIKREGADSFVYIDGKKAGMPEAKTFMKDLGNSLGPERVGQLAAVASMLVSRPDLSMKQVLGSEKAPAPAAGMKPQVKDAGAVTLGR